jgi:hypothetical protein
MAAMGWLGGLLGGGSDELGWDDLVRRVVRAIGSLARRADRGRVAFPPEVTIDIEVAEGGLEVIRGFVARRELDERVGAALANEHDCDPRELPFREYVVRAGRGTKIVAREGSTHAWEITIEGGDRDGQKTRLAASQREVRVGRGEWHGKKEHLRNDMIVCDATDDVSRRAARIVQAGSELEVESLDQGDTLVVRRASGESIRPARTSSGRVAVRSGDVIELGGVRCVVRRVRIEGDDGPDRA